MDTALNSYRSLHLLLLVLHGVHEGIIIITSIALLSVGLVQARQFLSPLRDVLVVLSQLHADKRVAERAEVGDERSPGERNPSLARVKSARKSAMNYIYKNLQLNILTLTLSTLLPVFVGQRGVGVEHGVGVGEDPGHHLRRVRLLHVLQARSPRQPHGGVT